MRHVSAAVKVGILVLLMVVGSYAVWKSIGAKPSGEDNYVLYAKFKDASGLPVGSSVMVAGLPVGEISHLSIEGRYAKIKLRVRDDVKVWSNAVVMKKSTSLLGSYYLEIDPGGPTSVGPGKTVNNKQLEHGEYIKHVVEATSPSQLMTRIEQSIPNVDAVLKSVKDLSEDLRRIVNGPLDSIASRIDQLVQRESSTVSEILARTNRTIARIELITKDVRSATKGADKKVDKLLAELNVASKEATKLMKVAQSEVEKTGIKVREKLDMADELLSHSGSIAKKIDSNDSGTLGKLVNDPTIADNIEEITTDAKDFLGTLFRMQTYVGLRSEWNFFSGLARSYITVEVATRPDKFYYIELEKGGRGDYPTVTLEYDPRIDGGQWVRRLKIEDQIRFTFQFGKRYHWASFRYGIKESTGGVGVDLHWFGDRLKFSADVFDMAFDTFPRVKVSAAYEVFRHLYILAGADDLLNEGRFLDINTGTDPSGIPTQFERFRYGRDFFFGAMLRFNDHDLTQLLFIGGSALGSAAN